MVFFCLITKFAIKQQLIRNVISKKKKMCSQRVSTIIVSKWFVCNIDTLPVLCGRVIAIRSELIRDIRCTSVVNNGCVVRVKGKFSNPVFCVWNYSAKELIHERSSSIFSISAVRNTQRTIYSFFVSPQINSETGNVN